MNDTLHTDYPEVTLEKVTSQPDKPSKKARIREDWPDLNLEEEEKSIHAPYPAWLLTPEGTIKGTNLLASWLWEEAKPHKLLGSNFSTIFSRNFKRIPKEKNGEFYTKKTSIMKRLEEEFGPEPYHHYIRGLKDDPDLRKIYEEGEWLHEHEWETHREWQYVLRIMHPSGHKHTEHLEFQVTVFRLPNNEGFFAIGKPHPRSPSTQAIVKQKYYQVMAVKDMIEYVHYLGDKKEESDLMITKEHGPQIQPEFNNIIEPDAIAIPELPDDSADIPVEWKAGLESLNLTGKSNVNDTTEETTVHQPTSLTDKLDDLQVWIELIELTKEEKTAVKGSIDHDDIWKEWER